MMFYSPTLQNSPFIYFCRFLNFKELDFTNNFSIYYSLNKIVILKF